MRVKRGVTVRKKHKKLFKMTKGMSHTRTSRVKSAREAVLKALSYSYRDRRNKKRDFRSLWITRISAACRLNGVKYSEFVKMLKEKNIDLDRKMLAELAVNNPNVFKKILEEK